MTLILKYSDTKYRTLHHVNKASILTTWIGPGTNIALYKKNMKCKINCFLHLNAQTHIKSILFYLQPMCLSIGVWVCLSTAPFSL
jgi:hypothetical protein